MMPLNHLENRVLVRCGLEELNRARRPGVAALMEVAGIERGAMTTTGIGFGLGPRINAAGRLDSAMVAYDLLSAENDAEAERHARHLHELNTRRQELTRASQALIQQHLEEEDRLDAPLIIASDREFQSGIVGLVAGRLTEEFFRPAIVIEEGDDTSRGSCRSIPQFDITHALDQCADLLVRHGGHALAAGFTVANENLPTLKDRLMSMAQDVLEGQELVPVLEVDAEVDIHHFSEDVVGELQLLEPTGLGNRLPVFMTANNRVLEYRTVGKDNNHLKLKIARAGRPPLDAIGFGLGEWADNMPEVVDLAFYVEINEWNGRRNLQLNLQDIRPADSLA
jgi:single-stranded-DNA-specific exonuclease